MVHTPFMGSGLSRNHRSSVSLQQQPPSARVIAADGSLKEFPAAAAASFPLVSVCDVLGGNADRFFVCNSDALYFDVDVPALDGGELLRPGQIYFVLPAAMLGKPLSSAGMAALAVRASETLAATRARPRGRARGGGGRKVRVMPAHAECGLGDGEVNEKLNERTLGEYSVMTWPASPARIAKTSPMATTRPPMRRALSTIEEDAE